MQQSISYYTLAELVLQHDNCIQFGMDTTGLDYEIALVVESHNIANQTTPDRDILNRARDILDARNRVFFDQDKE